MDRLVAGHARGVDVLQLKDGSLRLLLRHPFVKPHQRGPQPALQQDLPLIAALRRQRLAGHIGPPQTLQQQPRRSLGLVELVEFGGGNHCHYEKIAIGITWIAGP